jgi:GntR family transcriptional regulator/MocR family aminotransferase
VLYVGTFSKVLLPTLRIGFVVSPPSLMPGLRAARALADSHGALETQLALAEYIEDGMFARHVRRLVRVYRERRRLLLDAIACHLGDELVPLPSSAGLHTSATFADRRFDTDALICRALAARLLIEPLGSYYQKRPRPGLALGYGMIPADKVEPGIHCLAACIRRASRS